MKITEGRNVIDVFLYDASSPYTVVFYYEDYLRGMDENEEDTPEYMEILSVCFRGKDVTHTFDEEGDFKHIEQEIRKQVRGYVSQQVLDKFLDNDHLRPPVSKRRQEELEFNLLDEYDNDSGRYR